MATKLIYVALLTVAIIGFGGCSPLTDWNHGEPPFSDVEIVNESSFDLFVNAWNQDVLARVRLAGYVDRDQVYPHILSPGESSTIPLEDMGEVGQDDTVVFIVYAAPQGEDELRIELYVHVPYEELVDSSHEVVITSEDLDAG